MGVFSCTAIVLSLLRFERSFLNEKIQKHWTNDLDNREHITRSKALGLFTYRTFICSTDYDIYLLQYFVLYRNFVKSDADS